MNEKLQAALVELTEQAMASGAAYFIEEAAKGNVNPSASMASAFGTWLTEFLRIRRDLADAVGEALSEPKDACFICGAAGAHRAGEPVDGEL